MTKLKVTFTVPEELIKNVRERMNLISKEVGDACQCDIIRDELDKFTTDDGAFLNEVIPQIAELVEIDYLKESYIHAYDKFVNGIPKVKNGRGKHIKHGRHTIKK